MVLRRGASVTACAVTSSRGHGTAAGYRGSGRRHTGRTARGWMSRSAAVTLVGAFCAALGLLSTSMGIRGRDAASARAPAFVSVEPALGSVEKLVRQLSRGEQRVCAIEGFTCRCTGTVTLHSWSGNWAMTRRVNGSLPCTTDAFGDDPRPNFAKFCSCAEGLNWPVEVVEGLNSTLSRKLVPRVEIGPPQAGCSPEDDGAWTPCAIMNTLPDASVLPDRLVPRLDLLDQQDVTLRKLDLCHRIGGAERSLRVLGVKPSGPALLPAPVQASVASVCAVVFAPGRGPVWDGRSVVFCPTDPQHCLEGACECADETRTPVDVSRDNATACWACLVPEQEGKAPESGNPQPVNRASGNVAPKAAAAGDRGVAV